LELALGFTLTGELGVTGGEVTVVAGLDFAARVGLGITTLLDPFLAKRFQAGAEIDFDGGIGVGAGGIINAQGRVLRDLALEILGLCLGDFAHRDADFAAGRFNVDFQRIGKRLGDALEDFRFARFAFGLDGGGGIDGLNHNGLQVAG
jgi:hypothetical protein